MPMLPIPVAILTRFGVILEQRTVALILRSDYKKWLIILTDLAGQLTVGGFTP
jgi:hypothetical protein